MKAGCAGHNLVRDQVGAGPPGRVVLGGRYEELARRVERVRLPAGGQHALSEDEVDVLAFPDPEADPDVHLGAHRAVSHGLLRRALGGRDQADGHGAPAPGDRVGVPDRSRGVVNSSAYSSMRMTSAGIPGAGSQTRWPCSASTAARASRMATASARSVGFAGCGRQPVEAGDPRAEFHPLLEVDAPEDDVAAGGQVADQHVEAAALARAGRPAERTWRRRDETRAGGPRPRTGPARSARLSR